jgi:hypothetical protein
MVQRRVGDLGDVQSLGEKADAPIDLAQPLLAVEVVAAASSARRADARSRPV